MEKGRGRMQLPPEGLQKLTMVAPSVTTGAQPPMLSHDRIWDMIDALAARHGLSPSGLARRAGLDPTVFNRSKRIGGDGRPRWPSTESLAKILDATGTSLGDLQELPGPAELKGGTPVAAGHGPGFAEDRPAAPEGIVGPIVVIAVRSRRFAPLYRPGDMLVVSRAEPIRPGDRVLLHFVDGDTLIADVSDWSDPTVVLPQDGSPERRVAKAELAFAARILWVSQ